MNVLGFVSSLLVVISLYAAVMNNDLIDLSRFQSSYKNYFAASRKAQNKYESAYYKSKKTPRVKKEASGEQVKKEVYKEKKSENTPPCARLNLAFLFEPTPDQERLDLFQSLLQNLYENTLLQEKRPLLKKLISELSAPKEKTTYLSQIPFKDNATQNLFYHMLKGSLQTESYYPSLLDYVSVSFEEDSKICLACADHAMLTTLFGEKAALRLAKEKQDPEERLKITRSQLEKILVEENHSLPPESFFKLLRFTHPKKKESTVTSTATQQGIQVKKQGKL